jgi:hypothetical protein
MAPGRLGLNKFLPISSRLCLVSFIFLLLGGSEGSGSDPKNLNLTRQNLLPMVDGTVGSGGFLALIILLHSSFFLMMSLSGSTVNPKLRFWMLYSWPQ